MLTLKIDGKPVDLPNDFSITMNLKSPVFNELGSYSYPFKLPATPRNKSVFGHRNKISNTADVYHEFQGSCLWNGITMFSGTIKLKLANDQSFEGYLMEGNGDFNYQRKNLWLQDVDFGALDFGSETEKIEYINSCLGKFYPERDFCFPQILNKTYFSELPTDPWHLHLNYYQNSTIFYITESNGRSVIVPMLYLRFVLLKLFSHLQYDFTDSFFTKDPDFNHLALFNLVDCNTGETGFFQYDQSRIMLNYHVPRMTINEFLTGLENFFNIRFFVSSKSKNARLISVDSIVRSNEAVEFSDKIISVSVEPEEKVSGFRLTMDMQTDDESYKSQVDGQEALLKHIKNSVQSISDLNPWPASSIFDTRWVDDEQQYYILDSGKTWVPISSMYWTWNLFSKWIYKNSNQSVETKFSTLMSENVHPYNAVVGNKREDWESVSPKLFFVRLQEDPDDGKRMSGRCFVGDQYANVSNNLFYGGENGLLNKHYKSYFDFRINTKLVKITKLMSCIDLNDFDFSKKYMVHGIRYLVKSIQVVITHEKIMPATLECYTDNSFNERLRQMIMTPLTKNASLVDLSEENRIYKGYPGENAVSESSSGWAIEMIVIDPATSQMTSYWAEGRADYTFQWTQRKALTYALLK